MGRCKESNGSLTDESYFDSNDVAGLLVEVVAVTRRTILTSPALLPYTLAAGAAVTGAGALLGYGIYQLWPLLRHAIHLATAP